MADSRTSHARKDRLAEAIKGAGLDAVVLVPGANLFYALGLQVRLSERPNIYVVFPDGSVEAALPLLESENARRHVGDAQIYTWTDEEGPREAVRRLAQSIARRALGRPPRIGVEYYNIRLVEYNLLAGVLPDAEFVRAEPMIEELRTVKGPDEIQAMRQACHIAEEALETVVRAIRPGMTELEVSAALKVEMYRLGSEELPKDPVVASGERTALPHTKSTHKRILAGEALMIDTGARFGGYCSDITRTFFLGEPPRVLVQAHAAVVEAIGEVLAVARPGVPMGHLT